MAKRGSRDDRGGGRKAREKAPGGTGAAERTKDRAGADRGKAPKAGREGRRAIAELAKIERRLVEAQVILAEVTARADALEERMRTLSGAPAPAGAGSDADPTGTATAQGAPGAQAGAEWPVAGPRREGSSADQPA